MGLPKRSFGKAFHWTPVRSTYTMPAALARAGVPHELWTVEEAEHGLAGGDPGCIDRAYTAALAFVERYAGHARTAGTGNQRPG